MGGIRPSGLHLNKPAVFGLVGIAVVVFIVSRIYMNGGVSGSGFFSNGGAVNVKPFGAGRGTSDPKNSVNSSSMAAPPQLPSDTSSLQKKDEEVTINVAGKDIKVYTVQMYDSKADLGKALTILFLHGAKFSSQDWQKIKSMEYVANWGHRAFAVDLPGKGKTTDVIERENDADFLAALIAKMEMKRIVIVSPSMSGMYALPYLFKDPKSSMDRAVGYVPVAPVSTNDFKDKYPDSQLPTLIVYGTNDQMDHLTLNDLKLLPKHEVGAIEGAGHACYLDNPDAFHKVLYNFLKKLSQS